MSNSIETTATGIAQATVDSLNKIHSHLEKFCMISTNMPAKVQNNNAAISLVVKDCSTLLTDELHGRFQFFDNSNQEETVHAGAAR